MTVKRFQQKVKQLMKSRGWKKYRLAEEMGVAPGTLKYMFERKTWPKFETIEKVCTAFNLTVPEFFLEDIVVGQKSGETKTLEVIIEFVKQMPEVQQQRVLNIAQALAKDTKYAAEAIEDALKDDKAGGTRKKR